MKSRILKIIVLSLMVGGVFWVNGGVKNSATAGVVKAFGALTVTFPHLPLFNVTNAAPGDPPTTEIVSVVNGGPTAQMVAVRGVRTGGTGGDPKIETVLDLTIKEGAVALYGSGSPKGPKTVANFFTDSASVNGILLNTIASGGNKDYTLAVTFPSSAGDDFQGKSVIFDLTFGTIAVDRLIINEVYYQVDGNHGTDSPKDRGIIGVNGNQVTITIKNNGAGSVNTVTVNQTQACKILQSNSTNTQTIVNSSSSTGGNKANGNTGGVVSVISGAATSIVSVITGGSSNQASCGNMLGLNNEWVEIYNPTDHDISLKNWTITDNGKTTKINANKIVKKGGFAILTKDASTWKYWSIPTGVMKVELGNEIGDGLDNAGDHLILKDSGGAEADRMSWGSDPSGFTPPETNPVVPTGYSTERIVPGFDTDAVSDWHDQNLPTPGQ
jgi:hypothetical protein